jgi:hypothetical protein
MLYGDHQDVDGCGGFDIVEYYHILIFINKIRGRFSFDYFAEYAV